MISGISEKGNVRIFSDVHVVRSSLKLLDAINVYLHLHGGSFGGFEKEKLFKGLAALQEKSEKKEICPKVSTFSFEREKVMEES